jgi:hypothetical protein
MFLFYRLFEIVASSLGSRKKNQRWMLDVLQVAIKRNKAKNLWDLFREFHYLDKSINKACCFYVAWWNEIPVGCVAVTGFPGPVRQVV